MYDRFVKEVRETDHETHRQTRDSVLTDQERSVLIVFCCFEGEEPQINQQLTAEPSTPIIALVGASKSYGAVHALRDGDIALRPGEVRALMGENGAGKSTLVKVLGGVIRRDAGDMLVNGTPVDFHSPHDARDAGIAVIYQEPTLFPDLSVAENVVMGYHPLGAFKRIDRRAMHRSVQELLDRLGVRLDPERPVRGLSIADQQIVEIAKALSFDARVLIMDEPTAALSGAEVERLFNVVRTLREQGAAVLFISHRLEEVFSICDTVTVMRDGAVVHDARIADMTPDEMVRRMVGRELSTLFPKQAATVGSTVLSVHRLTREGVFFDISFDVRAGEIVALAGLVGAGRSEVARAIFGIDRADAGHVELDGRRLPTGKPAAAMRAGIGFVPEDRRAQGLVMDLSIARNTSLTQLGSLAKGGLIRSAAENALATEWGTKLQLKYHRLDDVVGTLSGGNQQKVVLAKWLSTNPKLLIIDEPTRGIDVGTKAEVHRLLSELAGQGLAVLMISSELPEVLGMADRVLVMYEGRLTAELSRAEADEESVIRAATGQLGEVAA
jgi:rhamnose transport system ATP-binding protein